MEERKEIPLNIVMTYPVHWTKYQVFRDFIQNFYDSVGYREWKDRFCYSYKDDMLCLWINGISFSYEWLLHIGGSTKTSNSEDYAGYFGEGFKIAALCAKRDFGWEIQMMSDDWLLNVISLKQTIDLTNVEMLGYEVISQPKGVKSCLVLKNISELDYEYFMTALDSFYYPENSIMGKAIWESKYCAVYLRSREKINSSLPFTRDFGRRGAVFCAYQMMGTNPFNLVICLHKYKKDDRERRGLYAFEVVDVFEEACRYIDANCAMVMLEKMRRYWNTYPKKHIDIDSWSGVIDRLIYKISGSQQICSDFKSRYGNLLCLKRIYTIGEKNKRSQAKSWLSKQENKYILVKDTFLELGYHTLEEECERAGGFVSDDSVNQVEKNSFDVLEKLCGEIFHGFFLVRQWPEPKIITNSSASYHGMAVIFKNRDGLINNRGIKVKYDVGKIYLKKDVFTSEKYYDALSTYVHELCHMFGGDASASFSQALTCAIEIMLEKYDLILQGQKEWQQVFSKS